MTSHRRFVYGLLCTCLGNALLAVSFLLDGGIGRTIVLFGALVALAGTATLTYVATDNPSGFSFDGSARHAPTLVLVGGLVSVLAGTVNLALFFLG